MCFSNASFVLYEWKQFKQESPLRFYCFYVIPLSNALKLLTVK